MTALGPIAFSVPRAITAQVKTIRGRTYGSSRVQPTACLSAVRRIGTNGVPFLMRKLSRPHFAWSDRFYTLADRLGITRALFADPEMERGQATTALLALPSLPDEALKQLRQWSDKANSAIGPSAAYILKAQTDQQLKKVIAKYQ
jgi:hypothetical protein